MHSLFLDALRPTFLGGILIYVRHLITQIICQRSVIYYLLQVNVKKTHTLHFDVATLSDIRTSHIFPSTCDDVCDIVNTKSPDGCETVTISTLARNL